MSTTQDSHEGTTAAADHADAAAALATALEGAVVAPGDREYDDARHVWNARFERRPDLAARCASTADVVTTVRWAREHGVTVSVKGGGHAYAGTTVADGGVLVDLSPMRRVVVDEAARRARVQAGATWADVDAATQAYGLATTGPTVSSVGVAGSTLGGGTGWLSRLHGDALDNLVAAEVVTADGDVVHVDEVTEPELFWGLRGAGHELGIVTELTFELHPLGPTVLAGQIIHRFDDAERLLRVFRDVMAAAPDEFQCLPFTFRVPPVDDFPVELHGEPVLDFVVFHADPEALEVVAPLREGDPVLDAVGPTAYVDAQQAFDPNLPAGARYASRAHDLAGLTDAAIDDVCRVVRELRGELSVVYLEPRGGAVARVDEDATAAGGRDTPIGFHLIAGWLEEDDDEELVAWSRTVRERMAPHATGGVYVNLLAEDEGDRLETAWSDPDRVRRLEQAWDPEDVLRGHGVLQGGE